MARRRAGLEEGQDDPVIYALASEPHYRAHLEPIVAALGATWVENPPHNGLGGVWLVAGYKDLRRLGGRPAVLFEHGAGQSYGTTHGAYAGGSGRGNVVLFVCPNEQAAARNRKRYPNTPAVVVGCPRVEQLRKLKTSPDGTVAVTWHWNADMVAPEAHWAYPHYKDVLAEFVSRFRVIGHAHPRAAGFLQRQYEAVGIEYVADFEEVCGRASVLVADNTSAMFEFAALDRPVVVANAPWYRREASLGGRFWDWADVGIQVDDPLDLAAAVATALDDLPQVARQRRKIVKQVYPYKDATARAMRAIKEVAGMSDVEETPEEQAPEPEVEPEGTEHEAEVAVETTVDTEVGQE